MTDTQADLVARLRGSVTKSDGIDCRDPALLLGAADTIERLRAILERVSRLNGFRALNDVLPEVRAALKDAQGDKT